MDVYNFTIHVIGYRRDVQKEYTWTEYANNINVVLDDVKEHSRENNYKITQLEITREKIKDE